MTFKRSVALAALLAVSLSSTTGFAAKRDASEPITDSQVLSGTVWTALKFVALQQYFTKVAPQIKTRLEALDSSNGEATKAAMDAMVAGLILNSMKQYFSDLGDWSWQTVGSPLANQLPEPIRSIVCD